MDGCTQFCDYDRLMNLRRWVGKGLKAYNVVVNELSMNLRKKNAMCRWVGVECHAHERVGWRF